MFDAEPVTLKDSLLDPITLLVVDDDESVLQVTRLILSRYRFANKSLRILQANSAHQARQLLSEYPDIAVVLLDVVMETDDAGLQLVSHIRQYLGNHRVRIVLRTGQAGFAPEHEVVQNYDINDYLSKSEATSQRLQLSLTTAIRSYRDIVAAEQLAKQLVKADQASIAKTRFLTHMSHEIRTPLNGLVGTIGLLAQSSLSAEQQQWLDDAQHAAQALLAIVDDVLDMAKIEAGKLSLNPQSFSLAQLVREVSAVFAANIQQKNIDFDCHFAVDERIWLLADSNRIRQILMNYLSNALKFTPKGGRIQLHVALQADEDVIKHAQLVVHVIDSGVGIQPEAMNRLFQEFEQEHVAVASEFGGSGLGLNLCRQLANLLGGEVGASSVPEQGSDFWLRIPVQLSQPATPEKNVQGDFQGWLVAVCEDDQTSRRVLQRVLEQQGAKVLAFEHGGDLLQAPGLQDVHVFLLDCHMPVQDGFATSQCLREQGISAPIVALTAGVTDHERNRCFASGMNDVIGKPVELNTLKARLLSLVH
ncbi:MAG: response regulator [Bacterioplanes sp.]|nr:response regulator [Bacterioplanes sp.]